MNRTRLPSLFAALAVWTLRASGAEETVKESDDEIAKKLSNPVASLISVPFQSNWDFRMGPFDKGSQYKLNFQPVIPINLNKDWTLIIRTIVPYISQENVFTAPLPSYPGLEALLRGAAGSGRLPVNLGSGQAIQIPNELTSAQRDRLRDEFRARAGEARDELDHAAEKAFDKAVRKRPVDRHQNGLGDIAQSFFFSPTHFGPEGLHLGMGPALSYPTATDDLLGSQHWSAGPTVLALYQANGWTVGILASQLWSFAGADDRQDINATSLQPFLSYQTKSRTTLGVNAESVYDWTNGQWTIPVNLSVTQLLRIGKLPVSVQLGGRYYADGPSGAPDWGLRATVTLVLPTGHSAVAQTDGKSFAK